MVAVSIVTVANVSNVINILAKKRAGWSVRAEVSVFAPGVRAQNCIRLVRPILHTVQCATLCWAMSVEECAACEKITCRLHLTDLPRQNDSNVPGDRAGRDEDSGSQPQACTKCVDEIEERGRHCS
jgi:hypothetical protein